MAFRLITGRLQQRSRYCAKQQQFFTENSTRWPTQAQLTRGEIFETSMSWAGSNLEPRAAMSEKKVS